MDEESRLSPNEPVSTNALFSLSKIFALFSSPGEASREHARTPLLVYNHVIVEAA